MYKQTPNKIITEIQSHIEDKVVCDLGCGTGDFLEAMEPYAISVIGVEQVTEQASIAANQGLTIENRDFLVGSLPPADIYYCYNNDDILGKLLKKIIAENIQAIFLIAITGSTLAELAMESLTQIKIIACNGNFTLYVWNRT